MNSMIPMILREREEAFKEIANINEEVKATYDWFYAVDCEKISRDEKGDPTEANKSPFDLLVASSDKQNSFKRTAQNPKQQRG